MTKRHRYGSSQRRRRTGRVGDRGASNRRRRRAPSMLDMTPAI
jgi:hypothetical protein